MKTVCRGARKGRFHTTVNTPERGGVPCQPDYELRNQTAFGPAAHYISMCVSKRLQYLILSESYLSTELLNPDMPGKYVEVEQDTRPDKLIQVISSHRVWSTEQLHEQTVKGLLM